MGNESKGISSKIASFINRRMTIPSFSQRIDRTESLNVSIATGIICSEFKRRALYNFILNQLFHLLIEIHRLLQ